MVEVKGLTAPLHTHYITRVACIHTAGHCEHCETTCCKMPENMLLVSDVE